MYMIQITPKKVGKMTEHIEAVLQHAGKLMSCIEELDTEASGERYGERMGMREGGRYDMDDRDPEMYGERRGVKGTGRYSRY